MEPTSVDHPEDDSIGVRGHLVRTCPEGGFQVTSDQGRIPGSVSIEEDDSQAERVPYEQALM